MLDCLSLFLWVYFLATGVSGSLGAGIDAFSTYQSGSARVHAVGRVLAMPLREIPHLQLLLRAKHLHADAENEYVRWFMWHSRCTLTVGCYDGAQVTGHTSTAALPEGDSNRQSFVIVTETQHLLAIAQRFVQRAGSFFFILRDESLLDVQEIRNVLHALWTQYTAFKNYILSSQGVFIYDPFDFDAPRHQYGRLVRFDGGDALERVLFRDMRGYPLRIQIFRSVYARPRLDEKTRKIRDVGGVDGEVSRLLQERMNFTMDLQEPDPDYFGERDANGSYNGVIGSIIKNQVDMCLTGFFVKDYMVPELDFTVAVYDDKLCIYVPKAKRIPQSILPILSVRYDLWLGFILTAFACALVWVLMRRINLWLGINSCDRVLLDPSLIMQFGRIYIDTWVLWVRVNIVRYPPFYSERIFIASLCLVSVIFGAIFESSLATVYIHPLYYKDINTMQELDESNLQIIYKYSSMADDLFFSETSPLFANLNKKLIHVDNLNADIMHDIAESGGMASVSRYTSLTMESLHFIIAKRVWIVPECPKYYTLSYVMRKDSPWEETVNNLLLQFQNAGLIKKWINDMQTQVDIGVMKMQQFGVSEGFKVLTVSDLQLAFYVIMLGSVLASISLLSERYLKRRQVRGAVRCRVRSSRSPTSDT